MSAEQARTVDVVAIGVDGVVRLYPVTPVGAVRVVVADDAPRSAVASVAGIVDVTVSVAVDGDPVTVGARVSSAVRALPGFADARVHVRISRVRGAHPS